MKRYDHWPSQYQDQPGQRVLDCEVAGVEIFVVQGDPNKGFYLMVGSEVFDCGTLIDPFPICQSMLNVALLINEDAKRSAMERLRKFFETEDRMKFLGAL